METEKLLENGKRIAWPGQGRLDGFLFYNILNLRHEWLKSGEKSF